MNKLQALQSLTKMSYLTVRIVSDKKPLKAFRHHKITKVTMATVRAGGEYKNLAVNKGRETGGLPYGEWKVYPYLFTHKGNNYYRLYTSHSMKVFYLVDGVKVANKVAKTMLPKSQSKKPPCIAVRGENLVSIKQKGKELVNGIG